MAKKKSKKQISSIVSLISAALGIVALVMIFLPAIGVKDTEKTYTGLQIVFGYKTKIVISEVTVFEFSFMNLLTYLLVIAGVIFTVLGLLGKGSKFATFIAAICFLVGGISSFSNFNSVYRIRPCLTSRLYSAETLKKSVRSEQVL